MLTAEIPLVADLGLLYLGEPLGWRPIIGTFLIFGTGLGPDDQYRIMVVAFIPIDCGLDSNRRP
jgi:hypothetical protein